MNIVFWVLQVLLALAFIAAGLLKLTQPIAQLAKQMVWPAQVPAGLVRFIGLVEVLGGIGLILPAAFGIATWLTPLAAVGLAVVMLLAAGFHAQRKEYNRIAPSVVLLILCLIVVVGRYWITTSFA